MEDTKQKLNNNIKEFLKEYNIKYKDFNKYKTALTHSSYSQHNNYERYEFIGDKIINLTVALEIKDKIKGKVKKLDDKFKSIINNNNLSEVAKKLNFGKMILTNENQIINKNILADSFEAIVGAIYDDLGLNVAYNFVTKTLNLDKAI